MARRARTPSLSSSARSSRCSLRARRRPRASAARTRAATRNAPVALVAITLVKPIRRDLPEWPRISDEVRVDSSHPDPRVVHEQVHAAQQLVAQYGAGGNRRLIANVHRDRYRCRPELGRGRLGARSLAADQATRAPASTSACAIARPRPLVAPVTTARVPERSVIRGSVEGRRGLSARNIRELP